MPSQMSNGSMTSPKRVASMSTARPKITTSAESSIKRPASRCVRNMHPRRIGREAASPAPRGVYR